MSAAGKRAWLALAAVSGVSLTGCVMPDQLAEYQKSVAELQRSVDTLSKTESDQGKRLEALETKTGGDETAKRSDVADLKAQQDTIVRETTAMSDKLDQVNVRVDRLSQDVQAAHDALRRAGLVPVPAPAADPAVPPGNSAGAPPALGVVPVPTGSGPNPNTLYTSAYADFSKGNYALAIQGFEEYAEKYPDTDLADNAMYWIGECQFSQGSYKPAIDAFDAMLEKYPKSDKAAAANLKKALAFVQLNQIGQGIEQLRYVTANYPGTDEARIAADRLQSLGKP